MGGQTDTEVRCGVIGWFSNGYDDVTVASSCDVTLINKVKESTKFISCPSITPLKMIKTDV